MHAAPSRRLRWALVALLALPGMAQAGRPLVPVRATGEMLGLVTDATGRPQPGVLVEVRAAVPGPAAILRRQTGADGVFRLVGLTPGVYYVEAGKGARVASPQRVRVRASERALLLLSLPELLRSARLGPAPGHPDSDNFDWTLRQAGIWRPVLRWQPSGATAGAAPAAPTPRLATPVQGYVALSAGAGASAFDVPDVATVFQVDSPLWGRQLSVSGAVGTNGQGGGSDTRVAATLRSTDPENASRLTLGMRQIALPGLTALPNLRMMTLSYAGAVPLGQRLRVQYGAIVNAVTLTNTVGDVAPYVQVQYQVGRQGLLEYRAISAAPPVRFGRNSAELPDSTPQVTLNDGRPRLEQAWHQELMYSDNLTLDDTVSAAVFDEHFQGTAINGTFSLTGGAPANPAGVDPTLLPDLLNDMFVANGGNYGGWGYRFSLRHRLSSDWSADLGFSDGVVLSPRAGALPGRLAAALAPARASSITLKLQGTLPATRTRLVCSYRAVSRPSATILDPYNNDAAQSGDFANFYLRQPLPGVMGGGAGRLAALIEIDNLLAQGYVPVTGGNGAAVYLVPAARSLRGGLTFRF